MKTRQRIVIPGGSGFLGQLLADYFLNKGWAVTVLSRQATASRDGIQVLQWDGRTPGEWVEALEGAVAVINLAGRSVNCRYHARNRRLMMDSRVESTRVIGEAIARCKTPPLGWLNASTATIYKHSLNRQMEEATGMTGATAEAKDVFSIEVATAWEKTFEAAKTPETRKVALRTAMVFDKMDGTVFRVLRNLAKFGLGGKMGSGKQFVSWIHREDFCRAVEFILQNEQLSGVVNIAAPNPVTNRDMMALFRRITGVPFGVPATEWMLELGAFFLRTETELIIKSRNVVPQRLLDAGFIFNYPRMQEALEEIEASLRANGATLMR